MRELLLLMLLGSLLSAEMVTRTQVLMGTYATITLDKKEAKAQQQSFAILHAVDKALSSYKPQSDIYTLNHKREVQLSPYTYKALVQSKRYYEVSEGYFDITVGSLSKGLYHFGEEERVPSAKERAVAKVDINGLHFTPTKAWLDEGITVDLGGMGKGFGVDEVVAYLHEQNVTQGQVALSGDIHCLDKCEIGIQDPFSPGVIAKFTTKSADMSISTSGNYERYVKTKTQNHLLNPKTKAPQQLFASITLISYGHNSDIDAYATAASVMPLEKAITFLEGLDVGYVLITTGGDQFISEDLDKYVEKLQFLGRGAPFACETL